MSRHLGKRTALAVALLLLVAMPAQADPPENIEEPIFFIVPDTTYDMAVFWNITRADFCAWEAGGFPGPPPIEEPIDIRFKETGKGAMVASFQATRALELWHLDTDADLSGPCRDTDDQIGPAALGVARVEGNDNDVFVSGTRMNAFGDRGQGRLKADDGATWHYSWVFHAQVDQENAERVVIDRSNLVVLGS